MNTNTIKCFLASPQAANLPQFGSELSNIPPNDRCTPSQWTRTYKKSFTLGHVTNTPTYSSMQPFDTGIIHEYFLELAGGSGPIMMGMAIPSIDVLDPTYFNNPANTVIARGFLNKGYDEFYCIVWTDATDDRIVAIHGQGD
jgi:hypothetical protein